MNATCSLMLLSLSFLSACGASSPATSGTAASTAAGSGGGSGSEAPSDPAPVVEPTPAKPKLNEIVVLSSDEGWVKQEIMRSAYTLEFPGEIDWKVTDGGEYIAFRASSLHEGRSYAVWGHRYIATAAGLQNPDLLDESYVGFALSSGGAAHERSDRAVGRDVATGLGGRFTFDMDGDTYFADLVVFRVDNVVFLLSMTTKGAYGPEADFARMVDSFSPTASAE